MWRGGKMKGKIKYFLAIWMLANLAIILIVGNIKQYKKRKAQLQQINTLRYNEQKTQIELIKTKRKLKDLGILKYKETALKKQFPLFSKIVDVAYRKSKEYGFDPNLVMSIIQIESAFKPYVVSNAGAMGLMQINYSVWKNELDIRIEQIFDIEYNIDLGLQILKRYQKASNGDILQMLHLYNNGYLYNNHAYKHKVTSTKFY